MGLPAAQPMCANLTSGTWHTGTTLNTCLTFDGSSAMGTCALVPVRYHLLVNGETLTSRVGEPDSTGLAGVGESDLARSRRKGRFRQARCEQLAKTANRSTQPRRRKVPGLRH